MTRAIEIKGWNLAAVAIYVAINLAAFIFTLAGGGSEALLIG